MKSLKRFVCAGVACVAAAQAGAAVYDITMDDTVTIVGLPIPVTATGQYDDVTGLGDWTLTMDLGIFAAPIIQFDQSFSLDPVTGVGQLNQPTNCDVAPGQTQDPTNACLGLTPAFAGPLNVTPAPVTTGPAVFALSSSFGTVNFNVNLDGGGPGVRVELDIATTTYECVDGAALVNATANVSLLNDAQLQSLVWKVDGEPVASTPSYSDYIDLGQHQLEAVATITTGDSSSSAAIVTVVDTTAPVITAFFSDSRTGAAISSIESRSTSFVQANFGATDACDSDVEVKGFGGFPLSDGDLLKIQGNQDKVELTASMLEMLVKAVDASGNASEQVESLSITE